MLASSLSKRVQLQRGKQGEPQELHPVVRDEIYRIAYGAIPHACTHSGGHRLEVQLSYDRDRMVRVADDGIGIGPGVIDKGRPGHFGLQGMRERASPHRREAGDYQ